PAHAPAPRTPTPSAIPPRPPPPAPASPLATTAPACTAAAPTQSAPPASDPFRRWSRQSPSGDDLKLPPVLRHDRILRPQVIEDHQHRPPRPIVAKLPAALDQLEEFAERRLPLARPRVRACQREPRLTVARIARERSGDRVAPPERRRVPREREPAP